MTSFIVTILLVLCFKSIICLAYTPQTCSEEDWYFCTDQYHYWCRCPDNKVLKGIYKGSGNSWYQVDKARCCDLPMAAGALVTSEKDWSLSFDNSGWEYCLDGYLLAGFYKSGGNELRNLERVACRRPKNLGTHFEECYNLDIRDHFDYENRWAYCKDGFYMQGMTPFLLPCVPLIHFVYLPLAPLIFIHCSFHRQACTAPHASRSAASKRSSAAGRKTSNVFSKRIRSLNTRA